jgi:hypothetical protein
MVYEEVTISPDAPALRQRAERCREMAKEYHPSVGAPLIELATQLERDAADLERSGVERRGRALFN